MAGLTLLLGLLGGALLGELGLRLWGWRSSLNFLSGESYRLSSDTILGYELRPGAPDWDGVVSSDGLRDREFTRVKADGVFRIAVVGDSVTFGYGVRRAESYPKVLETLLNQAGGSQRFEVMNFGVSGYNIPQIVEATRRKVLLFSPDLIIYGYCLNDPDQISLELRALRAREAAGEAHLRERLARGVGKWLQDSLLYRLLFESFYRPPQIEVALDTDVRPLVGFTGSPLEYLAWIHQQEPARERVRRGFHDLAVMAGDQQTALLVAVLPAQTVVSRADYSLESLHRIVLQEASQQHLQTLDLAPVFQLAARLFEESLFQDYLHFDPLGNLVAALGLAGGLVQLKLLPADLKRLREWPLDDGRAVRLAAFLDAAGVPERE